MKINTEMNCNLSKRTSLSSVNNCLVSESGMVLVLTLMILAIITAMVVEFSYGVYTTTSSLYNWRDSQKLSFVAKSGVSLAVKIMSDLQESPSLPTLGRIDMPVENILEGFNGSVIVTVEDESARFNLNTITDPAKDLNPVSYQILTRLLDNLNVDKNIADKIVNWMMHNPKFKDSGTTTKKCLDSMNELLLIEGIDNTIYNKLLPFVTIYTSDKSCNSISNVISININTASIPVIMSLADGISKEDAEKVVYQREIEPFIEETKSKIRSFHGFSDDPGILSKLIVKSSNFHIKVVAEENKIKRIIECVAAIDNNGQTKIQYWKEM